jgi:vacuolar-type H+-ATPase subunit D/Vma8
LSKHEEDLSNRRIQTIGFAHALLSKEFIIGDRKIVGRTDIPEDENECEKAIEERLDEVREAYLEWKKEDPSHTVEEFINILNNSIHFNPKTDNICSVANKLFVWDALTGKVKEDKFYLLKRLSLTAIVDRT